MHTATITVEMDELPPILTSIAEITTADDPDFPIKITKRARRNLFWYIATMDPYFGPCLQVRCDEPGNALIYCCDANVFSKTPHRVSQFGKVKIGVPEEDVENVRGQLLDYRSFPPGPATLYLKDETIVMLNHPGKLRLSLEKLKAVQPELFLKASAFTKVARAILTVTSQFAHSKGSPGWIGRLVGEDNPDGQAEAIETIAERLWAFPADPAVVISTSPFIVSVYLEEFDHVLLHRIPDAMTASGPNNSNFAIGDRLISCNGYSKMDLPSGECLFGPKQTFQFNEAWCVVADFLTDDFDRLQELKAQKSEELWRRVSDLGNERLANHDPCRDGRPWCSRVWAKNQKHSDWKRRGGYCS